LSEWLFFKESLKLKQQQFTERLIMREIQNRQRFLGQANIADMTFHPKCRDDIPQILKALQFLYTTPNTQEQIFRILEKMIPPEVDPQNGRPGMPLWRVFVMGMLKLNLDWDYDRLQEMMNQHKNIREMLGHSWKDDNEEYEVQTLKDNMELFTEEILDELNQIIVKAGHSLVQTNSGKSVQKLVKKNNSESGKELKGRVDSCVVQTNVHYPTDCNLLWDALRKIIILTARVCFKHRIEGWRGWKAELKKIKHLHRLTIGKKGKPNQTSKNREKKATAKKKAVKNYLSEAKKIIQKVHRSVLLLGDRVLSKKEIKKVEEIENYFKEAMKLKEQVRRRVLKGEKIPQEEKIYSVFERHTEWIVRGKAGVEVELGLRVCILEDQYGFLLHHEVMQQLTDEKIAEKMVKEGKKRYKELKSCSFDKAFHNEENQKKLKQELELLIMPRKGKLSEEEKAEEAREEFVEGRRRHASVESGVNGLMRHGLKRCRDRGIEHFRRNVALGVVARNLQKVGALLVQQEAKKLKQQAKRTAA